MLIHVLDQLFRPLARLAIARSVRFADAAERLRRAYLTAAVQRAGKDATDSQLSVLTGLQRRDIARLRQLGEADVSLTPDPLSRLVARWLAENDGEPLPRKGERSFDALARAMRKDIHPRTSLDALLAAGTVVLDGDTVHLVKRAYVPTEGSAEHLRYLADNVGDHLSVAVGNVLGDPSQFELAVHYDGLSAEAVDALHAMWRARMTATLQEVNARARDLQETSAGVARFRAGGYFKEGA